MKLPFDLRCQFIVFWCQDSVLVKMLKILSLTKFNLEGHLIGSE